MVNGPGGINPNFLLNSIGTSTFYGPNPNGFGGVPGGGIPAFNPFGVDSRIFNQPAQPQQAQLPSNGFIMQSVFSEFMKESVTSALNQAGKPRKGFLGIFNKSPEQAQFRDANDLMAVAFKQFTEDVNNDGKVDSKDLDIALNRDPKKPMTMTDSMSKEQRKAGSAQQNEMINQFLGIGRPADANAFKSMLQAQG